MRPKQSNNRSERLRSTVEYVSEIMKNHPDMNRHEAIEEAVRRFDLSPIDSEFLHNNFGKL